MSQEQNEVKKGVYGLGLTWEETQAEALDGEDVAQWVTWVTFYSTAYLFRIISFCFFFLHFILCRMCVCHMFNEVLTYLLTYLLMDMD